MPSAPREWLLYQDVITTIESINGAGGYVYNLAAAVAEGRYEPNNPPQAAGACAAVALGLCHSQAGSDLCGTTNELAIHVQAWTPTADTTSVRVLAGAQLNSDIRQALKARHVNTLAELYNVSTFDLDQNYLDGANANQQSDRYYVDIIVKVTWNVAFGQSE